ncbi:MAG: DUF6065 family protein [Caldilineaceae bacterium]
MKITAYPLYAHAPALQPAADTNGTDELAEYKRATVDEAIFAELALADTQNQGWQLLCPVAFRATWNGGPNPEDITISLADDATEEDTVEDDGAHLGAFVQSQMGNGILTFYTGYQVKTPEAHQLWVRGPVNRQKPGLMPLETMADTSFLPSTIVVHWQFMAPNQTVHFAAGEPFAQLLLQAQNARENVILDIVDVADAEELYEQAVQQMMMGAAVESAFARMKATAQESAAQEAGYAFAPETASHWAIQLNAPPPVSCICPTYGRVELLEEAIESFLRQDYPGEKELIVLNDYAGQTLTFEHPEVRVINLSACFHTVGEKYKAAVALATHDLIFVWRDNDIYLPHRLSYTVAQLDPAVSFFKADKAWRWNRGELSGPVTNRLHGGSCWRRSFLNQIQGYPHIDNGYDREVERLAKAEEPSAIAVQLSKPAEIYYLDRGDAAASYPLNGAAAAAQDGQSMMNYITQQATHNAIPQGQIGLQPHWKSDYAALAQNALAGLPAPKEDAAGKAETSFPPPYYVIAPPPPLPADHIAQLFRGDYPRQISVILPAANESVLLQRTVEQFAATLPENSEIIVVDNGSTDGCADFLVDSACPNIRLIRTEEPLGVAGARNRGLAAAQGEIVVFADAHIDVPERWWQPLVCVLNQPHMGVVGPGIGIMGKPDYGAACGQRIAEAKLRVEWLPKRGNAPCPVPTLGGGFMAMRHDTLKAAGAFDAGMPQWGSEDLEICLRYWLLGYEVWVAPSVTVLHYFRLASPYKVEWKAVAHNLLRVALLHLNGERLTRVLAALKKEGQFEEALAYAVTSDVWQKRAEFAARRVRDDGWLFEKFADSCPV